MVFNSIEFVGFIIVVWIIYFVLARYASVRSRNIFLLAVSCFFYGSFKWWFLILLCYIVAVNYVGTLLLSNRLARYRFAIVSAVVILSIGILAFMKYAYIWSDSIVLPVGLSFFTFQALSYSIDVYRGKMTVEKDFVKVALFISFLPTILSGPIERAKNIFPQLSSHSEINYDNVLYGIKRFIWGVLKKMVIADRLAQYVDEVYMFPDAHSGSTLAIAAIFYSIQIYCDFSGYADMAIGVGRALGFTIVENFNFPYFSKSIKDFWRRWHISLNTWFTDYVYISLGGNRVVAWRWVLNILAVFLLSGIWHGATVAFIVWGGIHGAAYLIEHAMKIDKPNFIYGIICFFVVTLAWIFFRLDDCSEALYVVHRIFTDFNSPCRLMVNGSSFTFAITLMLAVIFVIREVVAYKTSTRRMRITDLEAIVLLAVIALFGMSSNQFVYFQF